MGTGTAKSYRYFYSAPPRENVMLETLEDTLADNWGNMGGRCSAKLFERRDGLTDTRSCQGNLEEALAPHGIGPDDVGDVFNLFMSASLSPDGTFAIQPSRVTTEDHLDLRADMNILTAISACPATTTPTNGGRSAPLAVTIFDS
jgi:uncharacterized protein YcgI (DUF1989 family)